MIKGKQIDPKNRERKLLELKDEKINNVVHKLSVPRSSVHFLENYHEKRKKFLK